MCEPIPRLRNLANPESDIRGTNDLPKERTLNLVQVVICRVDVVMKPSKAFAVPIPIFNLRGFLYLDLSHVVLIDGSIFQAS